MTMFSILDAPARPLEGLDVDLSGRGYVHGQCAAAAAFMAAVRDGTEPFTAETSLHDGVDYEALLPADAAVVRLHLDLDRDQPHHIYARSPLGGIHIASGTVTVSGRSHRDVVDLMADIGGRIRPVATGGKVATNLWCRGSDGVYATERAIDAPRWHDVAHNYPGDVTRQALGELMALTGPPESEVSGKLMIWHGPPGTGKTTAIRALMKEWSGWCAAQYIPEPEAFFSSADYIAGVLSCAVDRRTAVVGGGVTAPGDKFRLIIAEDCDEFIGAGARQTAGAALGRLLNLADGILGQGSNAIILMTTNEDLRALHPALTRPGRCLAKIRFDRFSDRQAREWLGPGRPPPGPKPTLAELYEARGSARRVGPAEAERPPAGLYL
jgi:hypothetical protein